MATLDELLVKVGVDADGLDSGMDSSARMVERSFDRIMGDADKAGKSIDQAGDRAAKAFDGVDASADRAGQALRGVGDDADRAATEMGGAGQEGGSKFVSGVTSAMGGLGSKLSSSASGALDDLKGQFAIGGAAAGAVLVGSVLETLDREKASDQLAARLNLSEEQSAAFGRAAGNLYAGAWGESMGQINEALDAVHSSLAGSLGPADDALEKTTAKALDLASGFGVDVVEATGVAGFAIRQGLARDADHAFDLMVTAMQRMPASMRQELFPAIEEYSGFLHNLGFTGEEAFGLLAAASQEGSFGIDKTADALKELTIRSTDMSTLSVESFKAAGLSAEDMAARFLAGGDSAKGALDELVAGLLGIEDPVERSNAAIGLFGTPLEDLSTTEIPEFLDSLDGIDTTLGDVGGTAEDFGDTLNDNLGTRLESVKRRGIDALLKAIEPLLPRLEALIGWVERNPTAFTVMAIAVAALAAGFVALGIAAAVSAVLAAPWIGTALLIAGVVAGLILVIGLLIAFWPQLSAAGRAAWDFIWQKGQQAFNWIKENWPLILAILTGPIGLAVLAIVKHWDTIMDAASAAKNWIGARIGDIVGFFTGLPGRMARAAGDMFGWIGEQLKAGINSLIRIWNNFKFPSWTVPSVSIPGLGRVGGGTIGGWKLPHIAELADGGIIPATPGGSLFVGGEGRHDEAVIPLPRGLRSLGQGDSMAPNVTIIVQGSLIGTEDVKQVVRDQLVRGGWAA